MKFQVELLRSFPQRFLLQPYPLPGDFPVNRIRSGESVNVAILFYPYVSINEARSTAATSSLATTVIEVRSLVVN